VVIYRDMRDALEVAELRAGVEDPECADRWRGLS
jgi:hypothetical protein